MSVKIRGAGDLADYLKKNATMDDIKQAIALSTQEMQGATQRSAPVDTGYLKRSIEMIITDGGFKGIVGTSTKYAPYLEWGTRFMSAQPYFRPSYHNQILVFKKDIERLIDKR